MGVRAEITADCRTFWLQLFGSKHFKRNNIHYFFKVLSKFGDNKHNKDTSKGGGGGGTIWMENSITFNVFFYWNLPLLSKFFLHDWLFLIYLKVKLTELDRFRLFGQGCPPNLYSTKILRVKVPLLTDLISWWIETYTEEH